jgi:hypothetical protein
MPAVTTFDQANGVLAATAARLLIHGLAVLVKEEIGKVLFLLLELSPHLREVWLRRLRVGRRGGSRSVAFGRAIIWGWAVLRVRRGGDGRRGRLGSRGYHAGIAGDLRPYSYHLTILKNLGC